MKTFSANKAKHIESYYLWNRVDVRKSTFGARAERPVFINIEDRIDHLQDSEGNPTQHLGQVKNFDDVKKQLSDLYNEKHEFKKHL